MNTEMLDSRLFYLDPWLKEADVVVKTIEPVTDRRSFVFGVMLSGTIFYPEAEGSQRISVLSKIRELSMLQE